MSSNYKIETKCIQSGWQPKKGEPRVLPIYQSTTFKYETSEHLALPVPSSHISYLLHSHFRPQEFL